METLTLICSVIGSIATTVACVISAMALRQNSKMMYNQSRSLIKAQLRHRSGRLYLSIKNYGGMPAYICNIGFVPEFTSEELGETYLKAIGSNPFRELEHGYIMPKEFKLLELPEKIDPDREFTFLFRYKDSKVHTEMQTFRAKSSSPFPIVESNPETIGEALILTSKRIDEFVKNDLLR